VTLTQDAVLVRSSGPALVGADAIAASYAKAFKQVGYKVSLSSEQMEQAGKYVVDRGTFVGTLSTADGKSSVPVSGKYLHVLTDDLNGGWKFWRGSWTFANPRATSCDDTGARSCCCKSIDADDCVARPNEGCGSTYPIPILLP
jgi:ketosteroid isomerase-like protein